MRDEIQPSDIPKHRFYSAMNCDTEGCQTVFQFLYEGDKEFREDDEAFKRRMAKFGWRVKKLNEFEWIKRCLNCGHLPLEK